MVASRSCKLLLAVVLLAQLAALAQATRPGPMLRGTVIILHGRPRPLFSGDDLLPWGGGAEQDSNAEPGFRGVGRSQPATGSGGIFGGFGSRDSSLLDRMFDGPSIFGPPLRMFEAQPGDGELFGPPRRQGPCPFAHGGGRPDERMMKHMASVRFGPDLLSTMLAVAQADDEVEDLDAPVFSINPVSQEVAMAGEERTQRAGGDGGRVFSFRDFVNRQAAAADAAQFDDPAAAVEHSRQPFFGRVRLTRAQPAPEFTKPSTGPEPASECAKLHGFPGLEAACRMRLPWQARTFEDGTPRTARPHISQLPSLSWDYKFADGQLNGGVLVFCLLVIACVAVWARLLVLWCTFRCTPCFAGRRRSCRRGRFAAAQADPIQEGLEAPLLNPLAHEAPITAAEVHGVEVAAAEALPATRYVTLQYVPLKGDA